jgi:hypothetical protein
MKLKTILAAATIVAVTGCATGPSNYALYAQTQQLIAQERSKGEVARANALKEIAAQGDTTAKVVAVIGLQTGMQPQQTQQQMAAPSSMSDTLLKWASVVFPTITQVYAIGKNTDVAINNSNNAKDISVNTNETMLGFGRLSAGKDVPIVGKEDDVLLYPVTPTQASATE